MRAPRRCRRNPQSPVLRTWAVITSALRSVVISHLTQLGDLYEIRRVRGVHPSQIMEQYCKPHKLECPVHDTHRATFLQHVVEHWNDGICVHWEHGNGVVDVCYGPSFAYLCGRLCPRITLDVVRQAHMSYVIQVIGKDAALEMDITRLRMRIAKRGEPVRDDASAVASCGTAFVQLVHTATQCAERILCDE